MRAAEVDVEAGPVALGVRQAEARRACRWRRSSGCRALDRIERLGRCRRRGKRNRRPQGRVRYDTFHATFSDGLTSVICAGVLGARGAADSCRSRRTVDACGRMQLVTNDRLNKVKGLTRSGQCDAVNAAQRPRTTSQELSMTETAAPHDKPLRRPHALGDRRPRSRASSYGFVNTPIYRGSTVLYPNADDFLHSARRATPTAPRARRPPKALEVAWTEFAGAAGTVLVPSGLAAISLALLSCLKAGDHLLVTDSVYRPTRNFCDTRAEALRRRDHLLRSAARRGHRRR